MCLLTNLSEAVHWAVAFNSAQRSQQDTVPVRLAIRRSPTAQTGSSVWSGMTGLRSARITRSATAHLHNRICGFRAGQGVNIPLAPFAVPDDSGGGALMCIPSSEERLASDNFPSRDAAIN